MTTDESMELAQHRCREIIRAKYYWWKQIPYTAFWFLLGVIFGLGGF